MIFMSPLSPDTYAAMSAREVVAEGDAYDALRTIWPAAYEALNRLMVDIENEVLPQDTEMWGWKLYDLILTLDWRD